jgi:hypothetical protein
MVNQHNTNLERPLLCFGEEEEDHDEGDDVQRSIEAEGTLNRESPRNGRERDGQNGSPEQTSSNSP